MPTDDCVSNLGDLLWTFTGLRVIKTEFKDTPEGEFRLTFEDGRTLVFTAVGDDMTFCDMEVIRDAD